MIGSSLTIELALDRRPAPGRRQKPEPRRAVEHQPDLGLGGRQTLAGADEPRHPGPAPVVDLEPQRRVGLGRRVGRDPVDVQVAVVLAADIVLRVGVGHRAEHGELGVLERGRVVAGGRLHRGRRDQLHQVVDDHVLQRADRVVEVAPVLDAEALGHRDLRRSRCGCGSTAARASSSRTAGTGTPAVPSCRGSDRSGTAATRRCTGGCRRRAHAPTRGRGRTASRRPPGRCAVSPASDRPLITVANRNGGISR